ncbi:alpha/beta-hydrolase [Heliocybe sulcata]|uniref:Alpha/beta-hydrolase n=1 Tax=Heliocybe sulcata TaxID=5364 RepID=A0A5C3MMX7_9AGAM|nr:alpha/beta-hydrolase [Heliocybe sulcata]
MKSTLLGLPIICFLLAVNCASASDLLVATTSGLFRGTTSINGTERWLGIPFALPPVGALRFKAPLPITEPAVVPQNATEYGPACPQLPASLLLSDLGAEMREDCLYMNIWRPENTSANASLPVLVWFYGGAYHSGAASQPAYDPTRIIQRSADGQQPVIFVSFNYRVNTFGFLASQHVPSEDLNAGLQDQAMALTYIQDNISAFGGDPRKVTVWGQARARVPFVKIPAAYQTSFQSAGAGSVEAQMLYPNGKPLFRAAIMNSGVGPFKSSPFAYQYDEPGKPYARLLDATGCTQGASSFACLQSVPYEALLNISNAMTAATTNEQLWEPVVGPPDSIIPVRASAKIASGDFMNVPVIAGTNLNEGTVFAESLYGLGLSGAQENATFNNFIKGVVLDNTTLTADVIAAIDALYPPNDSSLGGPYHSGDSLFDRAEAYYTDQMFLSPRRLLFEAAAPKQNVYGYLFAEYIPGNPALVYHGSELPLFFGPVPDIEQDFADTLLDHYITFVNDLNPGPAWPEYVVGQAQVLQLKRDNITLIPDAWNVASTDFFNSRRVLDQFEK